MVVLRFLLDSSNAESFTGTCSAARARAEELGYVFQSEDSDYFLAS